MENSPKHNVPMKSAEIITEEISSKQDIKTASATLKENNVEEIKPDEIRDDDVYFKPVVKSEDIIDEMESIDIHEEDKTVSMEFETQQDKMLSPNNNVDDSESSYDSKGDAEEDESMDDKEKPKPDSPDSNPSTSAWTEKAAAIKNFVRVKSEVAVHTFMRRLSGKMNDDNAFHDERDDETKWVETPKAEGKSSIWNPLSYLKMMQNDDTVHKVEQTNVEPELEPVVMKGRIILYTRLGCEECRECRLYLHGKRLRYVEINIDIYPSRKQDLEKICGSSSSDVPKVFFNEELVGSFKELKELDESGELDEKIRHLIDVASPREAPLPPFSGEDDASSKGPADELALIVRKMKPCIVKDRFYKLRRFKNCFSGSDAVDFLSSDQCLERDEAIEVARKFASQLFFRHVLDENLFEDGNHLYWFLDDDPVVSSQCHNIPRGIIEIKPRPIVEIASRLRLLYRAILEAYTSPDGKHVDYRSIHGSEDFARYLRIIQELHRVQQLVDMPREEKLSFFINLYNMMAIHAILVWGHPAGPLERTKMFGEFKYVIGGYTYSLSAIQNGIIRGNQRQPYHLTKPFNEKDNRSMVALPYAEPLSHFALVCGTRSGPPLRCFSPGEIDKELMEATHDFLRGGGLVVDLSSKVAYISKIFNWYAVDFGSCEKKVLKHASTYLEPQLSEALLDVLVDTQFRVVYQTYDWGLNN
ncbi:Electron carrier/ protein disulfide oxidoreductase [Hirschfeldia incana]|nr:Electron carrier/ protein disulfide oxidoreductase [Hirschfeldia incana]